MTKPLRILHTSDWHLGRALYGRRRYREFAAFLDWLAGVIKERGVEVLLLAGDVFDSPNPSPRAQELYYRFLARAAASAQVVVVAGNHDSPALLSAPGSLLKALNIHVVGTVSESGQEEVLTLRDQGGSPRLIVAAVPYPRDRDLRDSAAGESPEDKERQLAEAIGAHYAQVGRLAGEARAALDESPPVVALGHLLVAGGQTVEGDGVRGLYIGSLGRMPVDIFPDIFDYVALGHLHQPQVVAGRASVRYSGAPLAMTFAEASRRKSVVLIEFQGSEQNIQPLEVPLFQRLERLRGNWESLSAALARLREEKAEAWLEVEYDGEEVPGDLRRDLEELTAGSALEILRLRNCRLSDQALAAFDPEETLHGLDEEEVFRRCLEAHQVAEGERPELLAAYHELLRALREDGVE